MAPSSASASSFNGADRDSVSPKFSSLGKTITIISSGFEMTAAITPSEIVGYLILGALAFIGFLHVITALFCKPKPPPKKDTDQDHE